MNGATNTEARDSAGIHEKQGFGRFLRKKESWSLFSVKVVVLLSLMLVAGTTFFSRFSIAIDPQQERCIPGYRVYLVDHQDQELIRGELYAFRSKDLSPIYDEGTEMLKYLKGVPGDRIVINESDQIFINDKPDQWGLSLAEEKLGQPASNFRGNVTLGENQYWFMGTSTKSFDSRYWGTISGEQIIGRAYPIF